MKLLNTVSSYLPWTQVFERSLPLYSVLSGIYAKLMYSGSEQASGQQPALLLCQATPNKYWTGEMTACWCVSVSFTALFLLKMSNTGSILDLFLKDILSSFVDKKVLLLQIKIWFGYIDVRNFENKVICSRDYLFIYLAWHVP